MKSAINDRRRFEQVIINLVNNAIKFTEQGEVEIQCIVQDNRVILAIRDTGIGIKPKGMQKIFTPFSQHDSGLTHKYEGTGLGLSISKRLLEMMGGYLEVSSPPGGGSIFTVSLSFNPGEQS